MFLINEVFAEEVVEVAKQGEFQSFVASLVPLMIVIPVFYFLLIRPQQKREKEHKEEIKALKPNDKVLTAGGIYAKVKSVKEEALILEITDGVEIKVLPDSVSPIKEDKEKQEKNNKVNKNTEKSKETKKAKKVEKKK